MGSYVPHTDDERRQMLETIGIKDTDALYAAVPQDMLLRGGLNIPPGLSELEVCGRVTEMSEKNTVFKTVLRGAGAYHHYIPAVVKSITSREELVTCYTPYQAEISQGVLQGTFEFQTMICELTGMDVANASHYDGATAAAESIPMCKDRKRVKAYVSACTNPQTIEVMKICGHTWSATADSLRRGQGCPKCANNIKKAKEQFIIEVQKIIPSLIVLGDYYNTGTPILCRCAKCGYEWKPYPLALLRGHGCPNCAGNKKHKVKCIETGKIYDTATIAAKDVGLSRSAIQRCCTGGSKTSGGYHWQYID